jgi:hypothetical protein
VFSLGYIAQELARRRGRALLTALGLGVGIALVVAVTALSRGVDEAQEQVFAPLTGIGTDLLVSRPVDLGGSGSDSGGLAAFATLPEAEQRALREENEDAFVDPSELGEPGESFAEDSFRPPPSSRSRRRSPAASNRSARSRRSAARSPCCSCTPRARCPSRRRGRSRASAAATSRSPPRRWPASRPAGATSG